MSSKRNKRRHSAGRRKNDRSRVVIVRHLDGLTAWRRQTVAVTVLCTIVYLTVMPVLGLCVVGLCAMSALLYATERMRKSWKQLLLGASVPFLLVAYMLYGQWLCDNWVNPRTSATTSWLGLVALLAPLSVFYVILEKPFGKLRRVRA